MALDPEQEQEVVKAVEEVALKVLQTVKEVVNNEKEFQIAVIPRHLGSFQGGFTITFRASPNL